jgi:hypothetical protein
MFIMNDEFGMMWKAAGVACFKIQLVLYDAVNRNKVSIRYLPFIFFLTHYMFRPLRTILRRDIQLDI